MPLPDAAPQRVSLRTTYAIALLMFALVKLVTFATAEDAVARPPDVFTVANWARWDSGLYAQIADRGYSSEPCPAGYPPRSVCSTAHWAPALPLLMRATQAAFGRSNRDRAALGVLWALHFSLLCVIGLVVRRAARVTAWQIAGVLALAAFWPGNIYYQALFPMVFVALGLVIVAGAVALDRLLLALVPALAIAFSHTTALGVVPAVAISAWIHPTRRMIAAKVRFLAAVAGPTAVGLALLYGYLQVHLGSWRVPFEADKKYGPSPASPLRTWWNITAELRGRHPNFASGYLPNANSGRAAAAQAGLTTVLVLICLVLLARKMLQRRNATTNTVMGIADPFGEQLDGYVLVLAPILWLGALLVPGASQYRADAALLPAVLAFRRLDARLLFALAAVAGLVAVIIDHRFFLNTLI